MGEREGRGGRTCSVCSFASLREHYLNHQKAHLKKKSITKEICIFKYELDRISFLPLNFFERKTSIVFFILSTGAAFKPTTT